MLPHPSRFEIDHRTIKLLVGVIAISLANLTSFFAEAPLQSISASYCEDGWSRDIFVGFLFAISAFLLAYNGKAKHEMVLSKVAALAAMGVAMFPSKCVGHEESIPYVHGISAAIMFVILAIFCYVFFRRAWDKGHPQARLRATIYAICGATIVASMLVLAIDRFSGGIISSRVSRLTFHGERAGLIAFGIAWLSASRVLPFITSKQERFSPLSDCAAEDSADAS
ncbi:MAG: hypothetical protein CMJ48_09725 [Planctomycetaceae bacterium]|nr:hypothetical protein [Planctomycetaceae bacterium]